MPLLRHHRITWKGVIGSGASPIETWQFSLKAPDLEALTPANMTALALAGRTCYLENINQLMGSDVELRQVEVASIDVDGKYRTFGDGGYVQGFWNGSVVGQASQPPGRLPIQTALCVSLDSFRAGASGKGRFFLPWPALTLGAGYTITGDEAQRHAGILAEFVRDVSLISGPVSIFSNKGFASEVVRVRVGVAPDTMRSRRGDMVEAYRSVAI